jgi:transposase-like protein
MKQTDVTCPNCFAGYRRIQLDSMEGRPGEYRCLVCDYLLEVFDGSVEVAYRLTVQPEPATPRTINIQAKRAL